MHPNLQRLLAHPVTQIVLGMLLVLACHFAVHT